MVPLRRALGYTVWMTVVLSSTAWGQQASGLAGVVTDSSGAVLPGVTVEAASPALIDKTRSVVTGSDGRYNIVDLRPGEYSLTFTLPGFNTLKREGIELQVGFTGAVNAQMQIGALSETVTVAGVSPLVDTTNTQQQKVLSNELLKTIPTGTMGIALLSKLVPGLKGASADVGGAGGLYTSYYFGNDYYHGKSGMKLTYDGAQVNNFANTGGATSYAPNFATVEETAIETGGLSAESDANGVRVNLVPKEGGNTFKFDATWVYTNKDFQTDNLSDNLRSRGVTSLNKVVYLDDLNATLGGPIKRDRLWFFASTRYASNQNQVQGIWFNKTRGTPFYTPDLDRPAFREALIKSVGGRVTWQAAQKHKVSGYYDLQSFQIRGVGELRAPEAQTRWGYYPNILAQGTWTSPQTNRLLLESGWAAALQPIYQDRKTSTDNLGFVVSPNDISIQELSTTFVYNAKSTYWGPKPVIGNRYSGRFSASYVTGSHAFKTGVQMVHGYHRTNTEVNQDINYGFLNGVPNRITQYASPYAAEQTMTDTGVFVQDRWTVKRFTVNLGLRLDYFTGQVPDEHLAATPSGWIPERNFKQVTCVPCWIDLDPRVGVSYDVFGNGRTAVKASLGRYVGQMNDNVGVANNPVNTSVNNVTRTWNDFNGNYAPDCNLGNFGENGECGPISDLNFGKNNPLATRYAADIINGYGVRDYLWDFVAEVQHQLNAKLSLNLGYNRSWTDNPSALFDPNSMGPGWATGVTDNLAVTPADFDPYCITAPIDRRLPGGGGYQVCGLYDVKPAKFGQSNNLVRSQKNFGKRTRVNDYFTLSLASRFGSGLMVNGSVDTGRVVQDNCFVVDSPQQLLNCHVVLPFKSQTLIKGNASYKFPWDITVAGVFLNLPGLAYRANYPAPNALIAPSLGRNLAACGTRPVCTATATIPLIPDAVLFEPRRTQLDMRVSKGFSFSRQRVTVDVGVFNVFNSSALLFVNHTYGPLWQVPSGSTNSQGFVDGRLVQFGGRWAW